MKTKEEVIKEARKIIY